MTLRRLGETWPPSHPKALWEDRQLVRGARLFDHIKLFVLQFLLYGKLYPKKPAAICRVGPKPLRELIPIAALELQRMRI
eukprot:6223932-Amphidinium_carterae.1